MTETEQTETRDIDVIHEFTDFATFASAVIGATLLKLDFDISTEIRKDFVPVRYWIIVIH